MERSFVMIKPDGVKRGLTEDILKRFTDAGLNIVEKKELVASREIMEQHYPINDEEYVMTLGHVDVSNMTDEEKQAVKEKNTAIISAMHEFMMSGPVLATIIEGEEGTVAKIREIVGKTNPADAAPGTIRGDYGEDSYAQADKESRSVKNLVHASGAPDEAEHEIKIWFPELGE